MKAQPNTKSFRISLADADSKHPVDLNKYTANAPESFTLTPDASSMPAQVVDDLYGLYVIMRHQLEMQESSSKAAEQSRGQWELSYVLDMTIQEMKAFLHRNPCDFVFMLRQMFTYIAGYNDKDANLSKTLHQLLNSDESGYSYIVAELERNTVDLKKVCDGDLANIRSENIYSLSRE